MPPAGASGASRANRAKKCDHGRGLIFTTIAPAIS
jgi:hypothetical protein